MTKDEARKIVKKVWEAQQGGTISERMATALEDAWLAGYHRAIKDATGTLQATKEEQMRHDGHVCAGPNCICKPWMW